jgi:4-amino-4-deoxy-L-arabinose transferase-like glycosyltransferase
LSISDNQVRVAPRARAATLLHPLAFVLLLGLLLRLALWGQLPRTGLVSDEGEYLSAATWLAQGRGFAWYLGYLWTRAPLYPLFVAAHLRVAGTPEAIFATQTALSLLNVALVYALARRVLPTQTRRPQTADRRLPVPPNGAAVAPHAPLLAALLMALYLPFAIYPQMLLSETLFITLLLAGFLVLAEGARCKVQGDAGLYGVLRYWPLALAGALFGLAALTRSLALGFIPIVALWIVGFGVWKRGQHQVVQALLFVAAAGAVVLPWTLYNSRLFGGPILVDTSGAFNALLGTRTAFDGRREDAQVRDFVLALLDQAPSSDPAADACAPFPGPLPDQAARQAAMTREAGCLVAARPAAFVQKSLAELIDLFQINYTGAERFTSGFTTGRLPRWYVLATFVLDDLLYVLVLPLGVLGWAHARRLNAEGTTLNAEGKAEGNAEGTTLNAEGKAEGKAEGAEGKAEGTTPNAEQTAAEVSPHNLTTSGIQEQTVSVQRSAFSVQRSAFSVLIGLWWLYNLAAAPLLFAINRFRLPLLPFVFIFAAYALICLLDKVFLRLPVPGEQGGGGGGGGKGIPPTSPHPTSKLRVFVSSWRKTVALVRVERDARRVAVAGGRDATRLFRAAGAGSPFALGVAARPIPIQPGDHRHCARGPAAWRG